MKKIFVSYSNNDILDFNNLFYELYKICSIEKSGIVETLERLQEKVSNCDIFVCIITKSYINNNKLENEFSYALKAKKHILSFVSPDVYNTQYDKLKENLYSSKEVYIFQNLDDLKFKVENIKDMLYEKPSYNENKYTNLFEYNPLKKKIFISYATEEDYGAALRLYNDLTNKNLPIFLYKIPISHGSRRLPEQIKSAIAQGHYIFIILSKNFNPNSLQEFNIAYDSAPIIIPICIDNSQISESIQKLPIVNLFPDWKKGLERLEAGLGKGKPLYLRNKMPAKQKWTPKFPLPFSSKFRLPDTILLGVAEPLPKYIVRYPYARFPDKVLINDIIPLEVIIKSVKPLSQIFKSITTIKLKVEDTSQKEIPVQIIVECDDDGFEIIGKYYAITNVPIKVNDSNPVKFSIKATKEGIHSIYIRFYQQETYVGEIKIESIIVSPKSEDSTFKHDSKMKNWKSHYRFPKEIIPGPDITIFIHERKISSDFEYDVLISSLDIPIQEMGPIKFPFNPETKFRKLFEDIENLNAPSVTIIDRKIKAKGMSLYDELFPESLKELYWEKRDKIESIRVISKEPWIPWEIIKPWRKLENGTIEEDGFLCEHYAFSRWIVGERERFKEKIKSIKVVVPNDTNLAAAIKERNWIEEFVKDKNIKISFDSSYDQVINTLETEKEIDILHFSTHGQNNTESPLLSAIELEGNVQLRPEEIVGKAMTFGQSHPIVILNACQTGNQGFSLTGIQGWATKFLDAGASVFIGTLWSVNDETAFNFVKEFYNQLASRTSLGESVKNARNKCKKEGDTSWLAYQLYGHPNSTIKF